MKAVSCNQSNGGHRKPCAQEPQRALHGMAYWPSFSLLVRSSCSGLPFPSSSPGTFHCRGTDHDTHFPDLTAARLEGCSFSASPPFAPSPHRTGSVCAPLVYCGWRPQAVCLLVCSPPLSLRGRLGGGQDWRSPLQGALEMGHRGPDRSISSSKIAGDGGGGNFRASSSGHLGVCSLFYSVGDFPFLCMQFLSPLALSLDSRRKPGEGGDKLGAEIKQTIYSLYVFDRVINSPTLRFPL